VIFKLWCDLDTLQLYLYYCSHHPEDGHMRGRNTLVISEQ